MSTSVLADLLCHPSPPKPTWERTSKIMEALRNGKNLQGCADAADLSVADVIYVWAWRYDRSPQLRRHLGVCHSEIRDYLRSNRLDRQ